MDILKTDMKFGLISDIHLSKKPYRLVSALRRLQDADILLVAGDFADRGLMGIFISMTAVSARRRKRIRRSDPITAM